MIRRVKMKLSENTVSILKNFSTINQNILVKDLVVNLGLCPL